LPHVVTKTARNGRGLFATRAFRPTKDILHIIGRIYDADVLWDRGGKFADNCYRFGPETYLDPGDGDGKWVNHSCDPNAAIRKQNNRLFLFAARSISAGEELTIDYATILGDDDIWTMKCNCGSRRCRKRVKRVGLLPAEVFADYVERGMIPKLILDTLGNVPE